MKTLRKTVLAICFGLAAVSIQCSFGDERALHVLFIGNSYTSENSLPDIFREITGSAGFRKPVIGSITPGGFTLLQHAQSQATTALIDAGSKDGARWDAVVLQEQSMYAALAEQTPEVRDPFLKGASALFKRIREKNPAAKVVFFQTWARHSELWEKSAQAVTGLGADAREMQRRIHKWINEAAHTAADGDRNALVAPVGDLWELNYKSKRPIRLHAADGSHPAFAGSYLAGLSIFSTVYGTAPLGVTYSGGLSAEDAKALTNLVAEN